ncbi:MULTISPECIES: DMT family transporter [unclassified Sphingobium]|uniref:DMT family transporter n=1 Tax=unclassified Sphingobium TaxID=2611147 RepID=UPI002225AA28|nr:MULTISPECIES: DMT family transporter [unclassified Sphingobium]MCW2396793.1 drug/metabolite transporter (DMT)-like permease [Sphingobium sp. B8D3B]MCW2420310.1 drug/metabolite transporter (DMT)-like permease [Sphingobium sp. B8D3C]
MSSAAAAAAPSAPARRDRPLFAIMLRLLAMMMIGATYAIGKLLIERGANLAEVVFYRQLFAFPVAALWAVALMGTALLPKAPMRTHITRTSLGMIGMLLNFGAVALLPLAEATSIGFTMPIFATILSALLLREQTGVHRWSAVLLGFVGVVIMTHPDSANFASAGVFVALGGAMVTALVAIVLRDLGKRESAPIIVFWFTLLSLPPLGLMLIWYGQSHDPVAWLLFIGLGLTGGAAQLFMTSALRYGPVSIVIPMDYSQMIWATLAGWLLWSYWPEPSTWVGAGLIAASGLYIAWREHVRRRALTVSPDEDRAGRSG